MKSRYEFSIVEMLRISPRFVVLLAAMCLSIAFLLLDILSVISVLQSAMPTGINPFWKVHPSPLPSSHTSQAANALTS